MDFSYLLELAKQNEKTNQTAPKPRFSTNLSKPKKISRPSNLGSNIQSFLKRKEDTKKKEEEEFRKKRENLLMLRAQDKKSYKRVSAMINRTKGASKSVMEDAKDIATATGQAQCDEDDYGYESAMSQEIFNKLASRYAAMPEDESLKFIKKPKADISEIKSRVISSLKKEEEEEMGPRKRKKKKKTSEDDDFINDGDVYEKFESIRDDPDLKSPKSKKSSKEESERSMKKHSSKEEKHKSSEKSSKPKVPLNINTVIYKSDKYGHFKYDKNKKSSEEGEENHRKSNKEKEKKRPKSQGPPPMSFQQLLQMAKQKASEPLPVEDPLEKLGKDPENDDRPLTAKEKQEVEEAKLRKLRRMGKLPPSKDASSGTVENQTDTSTSGGERVQKTVDQKSLKKKGDNSKPSEKSKAVHGAGKDTEEGKLPDKSKNAGNVQSSKLLSTGNISRPVASSGNRPGSSREFALKKYPHAGGPKSNSSAGVKGQSKTVHEYNRKASPVKRKECDEDSEYGSDMDDFIDDEEEEVDYSREIRNMFGYDKSRYRDEDDDIDDMEVSYAQVEKEEKISAKIGLMEDLEDMRQEEAARKRKTLVMKKIRN